MKKCTKCGIEKELEEFRVASKNSSGRQAACKLCMRKHEKKVTEGWSDERKARKRDLAKARSAKTKQYVFDYLSKHPCIDCGERDPIVLEFDHVDSATKSANISEMLISYSIENIELEIAKCEVRCANCHRRKTAKQLNWYKDINTSCDDLLV